jgi:hypothetical protein
VEMMVNIHMRLNMQRSKMVKKLMNFLKHNDFGTTDGYDTYPINKDDAEKVLEFIEIYHFIEWEKEDDE